MTYEEAAKSLMNAMGEDGGVHVRREEGHNAYRRIGTGTETTTYPDTRYYIWFKIDRIVNPDDPHGHSVESDNLEDAYCKALHMIGELLLANPKPELATA